MKGALEGAAIVAGIVLLILFAKARDRRRK